MIYAKKKEDNFQDLQTHTKWVVNEVFKLADERIIEKISKVTNYPKDKIYDLLFFSAYFHDIGKATKEFQATILDGKKSYHSYYSATLFYLDENFNYNYANVLFFTILTHHTLMPYSKKVNNFTFLEEAKSFFYNYSNEYQKLFNKECSYNFDFKKEIFDLVELKELLAFNKEYHKFRMLYSYVSGILTQADWIASARFNGFDTKILIQKPNLSFPFELRQFQKELKKTKESVLVEIPTGEGKTEGSILWAINKNLKIIYTLPTTTTSNKLYERIKKVFDNVGLIHSSAKVYLEKEYEKENGIIDEFFNNEFLFAKNFSKPVTVSTLDSLLKSFLNISRFNLITSNYLHSVIIVDEVHSYDFKMLGFFKRFLEICDEFDIKVCLMSASIPEKIKTILGLNRYSLITQKELFSKKANEIIKKEGLLEDEIDLIIEKYKNGKKVLVIKNTIKGATDIFEKLKRRGVENILLYHSTFKKIDRNKKEELIFEKLRENSPFILVATQVVEISLDIDFEVMFSDVAPIDSLIQRFGRVNRKKDSKRVGKIYIYKVQNYRPYYEDIIELSFNVLRNGIFELGEYNKWLNEVYDRLFESKYVKNQIFSLFEKSYKMYDEVIKRLYSICKSDDVYDLRDIDVPKIDFLLYEDYINDRISYEYTISLPIYFKEYEHKIPENRKDVFYPVIDVEYTFEKGIKHNKEENFEFI